MVKPSANRKVLKEYIKYLHYRKNDFHCPLCRDLVLPKTFEKHCTEHHNLNSKLCCVWCLGAVSWPSLAKTRNATHLFHCSRRFFVMHPTSAPPTPDAFDATPFCQEREAFGRAHDPRPKAYEDVWPIPLPPARLTYDIDSLNLASACVRAYLERDPESYWCHGIVRGVAFPSFVAAMDGDEGRTRSLPFFCWCDGGWLKEAEFRAHRHMILVSPSLHHFKKNVWDKIGVSEETKTDKRYRALHREPIQSALHLVNVLGYVSQRKSICQFSGDKTAQKMNHYHIRRSLPRDYALALVLEWPNGLYELLNQEFYNMRYDSVVRCDMVLVNAQWRIPIRSIPGIGRGKRLPLVWNWHPCPNPTPHALHLLNGKTLYFKFKDSPSDLTICLYDAVQDETWAPRPFHQRLIRNFRPYLNRNAELEKEVEKLQAENDQLRNENTQLPRVQYQKFKNENVQLRAESVQQRAEIFQLRNEMMQLRNEMMQLRTQINQPDS